MEGTEPHAPRWESIDFSEFLSGVTKDASARVVNPKPLGGGASKDIWSFEVVDGAESPDSASPRRYVLRRNLLRLSDRAFGVEGEYDIMRAASEAGVRIPRLHHLGRDADGYAFFIMDYVEGETLAPRLFRKEMYAEARERIPAQLGEFLAPIHAIRCDERLQQVLGKLPTENPARLALDQYETSMRRVARDPHPVFELAFRYLAQRLPEKGEIRLVHGDYRLGNVIFGPEGLRAVLDWELAHFGDPMEDLAWPAVRAWRFGQDDRPVAGLGSREQLQAAYLAAGGRPVDPDRLRWWEIFGNLRWGVITLVQASHFLQGETRDLEKAVIGRRASEVQAQLLNLIRE